MAILTWDQTFKDYEYGVDHGVLYFPGGPVVWNGLVKVTENPRVGESSPLYMDGILFNLEQEPTDYQAVVEAYTYPYFLEQAVLALCDQRTLVNAPSDDFPFGFSYRTSTGQSYIIHLVYNVVAINENLTYGTTGDTLNFNPFVFNFYSTPIDIPGGRPSGHLMLDMRKISKDKTILLENLLYGSSTNTPRMPTVDELLAILNMSTQVFGTKVD